MFSSDVIPKIASNIKRNKPAFEFYSTFQFVWIDLDVHNKFKNHLQLVEEKSDDFSLENLKAFGLIANNKKISCLNEMINFDDWVYDLLDSPETQHFIYISEIFKEDFTHYLKSPDDTIFKV